MYAIAELERATIRYLQSRFSQGHTGLQRAAKVRSVSASIRPFVYAISSRQPTRSPGDAELTARSPRPRAVHRGFRCRAKHSRERAPAPSRCCALTTQHGIRGFYLTHSSIGIVGSWRLRLNNKWDERPRHCKNGQANRSPSACSWCLSSQFGGIDFKTAPALLNSFLPNFGFSAAKR
jgi:hypothetical protein